MQSVLNDHYQGPKQVFGHGKKVSWKSIEAGLTDSGFVCPGTCVLLEPSTNAFMQYRTMIQQESHSDKKGYGYPNCYSGFDEQSINEFFWKHFEREQHSWTHISQNYNFIPWHFKWIQGEPKLLHYFGKNVWEMTRTEWTDVQVWWNLFESLCRSDLYTAEELKLMKTHLTEKQRESLVNRPTPKCFWCESKQLDFNHNTIDPVSGALICPVLTQNSNVDTEIPYPKKTQRQAQPSDIDYF